MSRYLFLVIFSITLFVGCATKPQVALHIETPGPLWEKSQSTVTTPAGTTTTTEVVELTPAMGELRLKEKKLDGDARKMANPCDGFLPPLYCYEGGRHGGRGYSYSTGAGGSNTTYGRTSRRPDRATGGSSGGKNTKY